MIELVVDTKDRLYDVTDSLFTKYGIRSVTMDDIAKALGVSKKTLYQYVKDKDELVFNLMESVLAEKEKMFSTICDQASSPIHELNMISDQLRKDFNEANPSMMFDLEKYYPNAWELWLKFKNVFIKGSLIRLMEAGIGDGTFRNDINPEILATLRVEQIQMAFDDRIFSRKDFNFLEVQMAFFDHFVHGILTSTGKKMYNDCCK